MNARALFVAADDRIRAPWRILLFLALVVVTGAIIRTALIPVRPLMRDGGSTGWGAILAYFVLTVGFLVAHAIMLRIDRRSWSYVALDRDAARPRRLGLGWLLGAAPIAVASFALLAVGWLKIVPALSGSWTDAAIRMSLLLLPAALIEELLSRGYFFATLREWLGAPVAVGLTSLGFGLLHYANPGANALSIVLVTIGGVQLAVILIVTRSLYAAWMAHWGWNWVMAVLLHVQVSGNFIPRPDYKTIEVGPDWMTGGRWGPEGGVPAGVADLMVIGGLLWFATRKRERATG